MVEPGGLEKTSFPKKPPSLWRQREGGFWEAAETTPLSVTKHRRGINGLHIREPVRNALMAFNAGFLFIIAPDMLLHGPS